MAAGNERDWQDQPRAFGFGGYLSLSLPGSVATRCAVVLELVRVSSVYLFIYRRRRVLVLHSRQAKRLSSRCLGCFPCWLGFVEMLYVRRRDARGRSVPTFSRVRVGSASQEREHTRRRQQHSSVPLVLAPCLSQLK